ncbi:MAG: hypothetical protein PUG00_10765, partial [Clostridiales bacterium]|nr:hypothetical protein [Clostridiales bacterium]
ILDYVNAGGDLFFFHDAMTPYAKQGAVNLTKSLLSIVGMNRYHVDLTNQKNSYTTVSNKIKLTKAALVNRTVDEDGTDVYVKHDITGNGQLELGTLTESGDIYELVSLKTAYDQTYTNDPNGLLEKGKLAAPGTLYTYINAKADPSDKLVQTTLTADGTVYNKLDIDQYQVSDLNDTVAPGTLESDGTVYHKYTGIDDSVTTVDNTLISKKLSEGDTVYKERSNASGLDKVDNIAAGTEYYEQTKLVYGNVKAGQEYFRAQSDGYYAPDWNQMKQVSAELLTEKTVNNKNVQEYCKDLYYIKSAAQDTEGYYYENIKASDLMYVGDDGSYSYDDLFKGKWKKFEAYTVATASGGESGYVPYTAKQMYYIKDDGKRSDNPKYFSAEAAKAGETGYTLITSAVKKNYINDSMTRSSGWFTTESGVAGDIGYVDVSNGVKETYVSGSGDEATGWFIQSSGPRGTKGYVKIGKAKQENYIDSANKVQSGWFISRDGLEGESGYIVLSGAGKEKYVDDDGKVSEGYFKKSSGEAGNYGYVMISDAEEKEYLDESGNLEKGWFTSATGNKGDNAYIMTEPGEINFASSVLPNAMLRDSSSEEQYITNYAFNTTNGQGMVSSMNANLKDAKEVSKIRTENLNYFSDNLGVYVSGLAMTALYTNGNMAGATNTQPYVYAGATSFKKAVEWSSAANGADYSETMKAAQLNSGVVTKYPYNIGTSLNVAGTHQQAYALDLDNKNTTVWYTLAGSNNKSDAKNRSSKYAASPGDGMESYYIYTTSYGSGAITYCGSGHSSVTGKGKRNNDERKLFINVIVNSATAVPESPIITCFEPTGTFETKDELEKDVEASNQSGKKIYSLDVDTKTDSPEFDFEISIPEGTKLSNVRVFYDLDYLNKNDGNVDYNLAPGFNDSDKDADGNDRTPDVLIKEYDKRTLQSVESSLKSTIRSDIDKLKLQESYFSPYGGFYTFIVVQVTYEGGTAPVYAIIKVKASDPLFDLTENTMDVPVIGDFVAEKKFIYA